jgi:hypothetical protein
MTTVCMGMLYTGIPMACPGPREAGLAILPVLPYTAKIIADSRQKAAMHTKQ